MLGRLQRNSKEAGLKFIDIVSTQTSTTSEPKLRVRNGVVLVFVSGHSAQSQQEQGFTRRHEGTELGF